MNYYSLEINGNEYKLRITSRLHAELDMKFSGNGGFMAALSDSDTMMNQNAIFKKLIPTALKPFTDNPKLDADEAYDQLVDDGWKIEEFMALTMGVAEVSGFLTEGTEADLRTEIAKAKAEREAKANAEKPTSD